MTELEVYKVLSYALMFILGSSIGSFLLVIIRRSEQGKSWSKGRSKCENCGKELQWWELIPTISFLILGGKCSGCKVKIDETHFICETYLGLTYMAGLYILINTNLGIGGLLLLLLTHTILWITAINDWYTQTIKVLPIYILSIVGAVSTLDIKFIALIIGLLLVSEFLITDNMKWMGAGDIDIIIAVFAVTQNIIITFDTLVNASIIGLILYGIGFFKKEKQLTIPFVPLLYFGYVFASFKIGMLNWGL